MSLNIGNSASYCLLRIESLFLRILNKYELQEHPDRNAPDAYKINAIL